MKKQYMAPAFTPVNMMIASAASPCALKNNFGWEACPVELGGGLGAVFTMEQVDCTLIQGSDDLVDAGLAYDSLCYYNMLPPATVFGS